MPTRPLTSKWSRTELLQVTSKIVPRWQQWPWRAKALIVALILAAGLLYVSRQRDEAIRMVAVEANNAKALELQNEIARRFAIGTPESQIVEFMRKEHPGYQTMTLGDRTEYWVPIGKEPSGVWYCGSFTAYVAVECAGARLTRTRIARWSADCL